MLSGDSYPTPACFSPKAFHPRMLRGGWWVRPPGSASRLLGEALTLGRAGGACPRTAVSLASQPQALIRLTPWPLLFLASWMSLSCLPSSLVLGRLAPEERPNPFPALGWESGLLDSLPTDSQHHHNQALVYLSFPPRHKEMTLSLPLA